MERGCVSAHRWGTNVPWRTICIVKYWTILYLKRQLATLAGCITTSQLLASLPVKRLTSTLDSNVLILAVDNQAAQWLCVCVCVYFYPQWDTSWLNKVYNHNHLNNNNNVLHSTILAKAKLLKPVSRGWISADENVQNNWYFKAFLVAHESVGGLLNIILLRAPVGSGPACNPGA